MLCSHEIFACNVEFGEKKMLLFNLTFHTVKLWCVALNLVYYSVIFSSHSYFVPHYFLIHICFFHFTFFFTSFQAFLDFALVFFPNSSLHVFFSQLGLRASGKYVQTNPSCFFLVLDRFNSQFSSKNFQLNTPQ